MVLGMKKFHYIEIARGMAALLVVLHHATLGAPDFYGARPFENFFNFGKAGVDFFFVLSGFIIYYVHSDDEGTVLSIRRYIVKRFIRVYPIFLFVSFILLSAYVLLPQWSPQSNIIDFSFLTSSFLLLPSPERPLLTVSWTLVHEVFFYCVFILLILNKNLGWIVFVFWAMMILGYNLLLEDGVFPYSFYLSEYNLEFLFGVVVAVLFKSDMTQYLQKYSRQFVVMGGVYSC